MGLDLFEQFRRGVAEDIRRNGFSLVGVDGDGTNPPFVHSIGLQQSYQHPELIIVGLDLATMQTILNQAAYLVQQGQKFEADSETSDLLADDYKCAFKSVAAPFYEIYLEAAVEYYGNVSFAALQCVWQDHRRCYPWEVGVSPIFRLSQPVLVTYKYNQ